MSTTPQITITVTPQGEVQLQSNVDQPLLVYGMLERAKDAARTAFEQRANGNSVVPVAAAALKQLQGVG